MMLKMKALHNSYASAAMDNMFCAAEINSNLLPLKNIDHIYEVVNKMEMRAIYSSSLQAIC